MRANTVRSSASPDDIDGYVRRVNEDLQRWQQIKTFRVPPRDLDVEHGDLTPRRPVVEREFKDLIDDMHSGTREE
ncbi:hypothetical protein ACIP9H_02825 [Streptomyces sp. NPDC088732]|uniref:hypothetical protein n=1 Tax=Streptomyces sp. NPDC088732 TaxID=3365879 RepID=UPI003830A94F